MAKIFTQTIPAEYQELYSGALGSREWLPGEEKAHVRLPFRQRNLQGCRTIRASIVRGGGVTAAMCAHRRLFGKCVKCFQVQPWSGGAEPAGVGPYSRTWWYSQSGGSGLWYYDYFMQQTIDGYIADDKTKWCSTLIQHATYVDIEFPFDNYGNQLRIWCRVFFAGEDQWILIRDDSNYFENLYLWVYGFYVEPPSKSFSVGVYEIDNDWNQLDVTWHTKPPLGALISTRSISQSNNNSWVRFFTNKVKAVAIRVTSGKGYFYAYGRQSAATSAYMAP